jgi:small subunit ribosomal protein S4
MSRYIGPKLKIVRRLGELPGFCSKIIKKRNLYSSNVLAKITNKKNLSEYSLRLKEKQKLRFNYGLSEKQLYCYLKEAKRLKGATGLNLLKLVEMRLDNIVYRLGFSSTIVGSRQLLTHGHILVNNKKINLPNFQCQVNDIISLKLKSKTLTFNNLNLLGGHLEFDKNKLIGKVKAFVTREDISFKINELAVVEFYSRK